MTQEQNAKYKRLNELSQLNGNIGRLAFYMTTTDVDSATEQALNRQLEAMTAYRSCLENRIEAGIY